MSAKTADDTQEIGAGQHSIVSRQLRALGVDPDKLPATPSWLADFVEAVGAYYQELEMVRNHLEKQLRDSYSQIHTLEDSLVDLKTADFEQSVDHYHNLFEKTPIPTWEENFEGVAIWLRELRAAGVKDLARYLADNHDEFKRGVSLIEVTNVNPAAAKLVGVPDEVNLLGPLHPDILDEDSMPSFLAQFLAIWNSEDSKKVSVAGTRYNGEKFDGLIEWKALKVGGAFDYSRVLVTIVDITDQKAIEREAVESLKTRDEMLASVTHELRTPLAAVMGFAEILRAMDDGDYEEERDGLLGIITHQAADLSNLVEDLLASARSELGQLDVASVPVDVHAQIAQVMESRSESERAVRLPDRPEEPALASGDPQRVRQILRNLITNATRYGGPQIAVDVVEDARTVTVAVLDDGDGLPEGDADKVFERYYRPEGAKVHTGSVGLGLNIARDLARRMGGDLSYGRRDGWTRFELHLPKLVR